MVISISIYQKLHKKGFKGFMPLLVLLIICESVSTIIFEFSFWLGSSKSIFNILIFSFAIGGEVSFKLITLWLFGMKYLKSCLEMPNYYNDERGQI